MWYCWRYSLYRSAYRDLCFCEPRGAKMKCKLEDIKNFDILSNINYFSALLLLLEEKRKLPGIIYITQEPDPNKLQVPYSS